MDDMISRQAAIDRATKEHDFFRGAVTVSDKARRDELLNVICWLGELPPVQPERIRGRWIETGKYFPNTHWQLVYEVVCDKCNGIAYLRKSDKAYIGANICPNCGNEFQIKVRGFCNLSRYDFCPCCGSWMKGEAAR